MARHFAPTKTCIWDDEEFHQLSSDAQRLYWMLYSQSGISSVGIVPMAMKRWANSTKGMTIKALSKTLQELFDALYVVVDWDREEVLVRSFVRHDGGYTNSLRLKSIQKEARAVGSKVLGAVLAHELNRLGVEHLIPFSPIDVHSKTLQSPIEDPSKTHGYGYVSAVGTGTGNQKPEAAPLQSGTTRATRIPEDFTITDSMRSWAKQKHPNVNLEQATEKFINYWLSRSGAIASKLDWPATWRNWIIDEAGKVPAGRVNGYASGPERFGRLG